LNESISPGFQVRYSNSRLAGLSRVALVIALAMSPAMHAEAGSHGKKSAKTTRVVDDHQVGKASWYGPGFHGKKTASGQVFNQHALTAAHPHLPLGSRVRVTNLKNGKEVEVTINDRGPHKAGRIIDLSRAAAKKIAMGGLAKVKVVAVPY
jgi:rare lipoprotein A